MRKPILIEKENLKQTSVTRNENHSLRWLIHLLYVVFIPFYFVEGIMTALRNMERSFPDDFVLSLFLACLTGVAIFIALFYNFELLALISRPLKLLALKSETLVLYR